MSHRSSITRWESALTKLVRARKQNTTYPYNNMEIIAYAMLGCVADDVTDHFISTSLTCERWFDHCTQVGLISLITKLNNLSDYLRSRFPLDVSELPDFWLGFKHQLQNEFGKGPIPSVLRRRVSCIDTHNLAESIGCFADLEQICCFLKRCLIDNSELDKATINNFYETVDRVKSFNESTTRLPLVKEARRIAKRFARAPLCGTSGRHGPKSTYEVTYQNANAFSKLRYLVGDRLLEKYADYPYVRCFVPRVSKMSIVPKSATKRRTIAKERTALMWAQQAIKEHLYSHIDSVEGINIHDDSVNGHLAVQASIDGLLSTIDLSAASDSVSLRAFELLFKGSWLYDAIVDTRSTYVEIDGKLCELPMVNTMGAATCFPVETIVFYSLSKAVLQHFGYMGDPYVFGDDIIVPTKFVQYVIDVLEQWGFIVNRDKSFTNPRLAFRESCGCNAIHGIDVTPIMVSKFLPIAKITNCELVAERVSRRFLMDNFGSFLELSEHSQFRLLRSFIIRLMRQYGIPYYHPSRERFSESDPNNLYKSVESWFVDHTNHTLIVDTTTYAHCVQSTTRVRQVQYCDFTGNTDNEASEYLRWFVYWHYPMWDADGFYTGPDQVLLGGPNRLALTAISYDFSVIR